MFDVQPGTIVEIQSQSDTNVIKHEFENDDILAIKAALAAERPLLLLGEPGVGKSQLARAAAVKLKRAYVTFVVDAQTEVRDLRWQEDAVARLARAQLANATGQSTPITEVEKSLSLENFIIPGPLWWGMNWTTAEKLAVKSGAPAPPMPRNECSPRNGAVVLIDEIDKADTQVPNGLLEALGAREFQVNSAMSRVTVETTWPLVMVTSNGERRLPPAFIRRCVVHEIKLPKNGNDLQKQLLDRGKARFENLSDDVVNSAAKQTVKDREFAKGNGIRPLPGQAEFFDLLTAVDTLSAQGHDPQQVIDDLSKFFLKKDTSTNV